MLQNALLEHSAILLTFINLPLSLSLSLSLSLTFVLSMVEWPLKTGFTVCCKQYGTIWD